MLVTDAKLYLPITDGTISRLVDGYAALDEVLNGVSVPEISALLVIQSLHKLPADNVAVLAERALAQTLGICQEHVRTRGHTAFMTEAVGMFDVEQIRQGYAQLDLHGIYCLDHEDIGRKDFLDTQGEWDFTFRQRHLARLTEHVSRFRLSGVQTPPYLTEQQARIYAVARGDLDDHLHVQGYAGTGKSHLIRALLDLLRGTGGRILVLAERWPQLQALIAGVEDKSSVTSKTFGQLASAITPNDLTSATHLRMRRGTSSFRQVPDSVYIDLFGVKPCGRLSARDIVRAAHATVTSFCNSNDSEIEPKHIPKNYSIRDELVRAVVVKHAREFWLALLNPPGSFDPPIRDYHQVKYAALNQWRIPRVYTHVVIDECHNLSRSMMQILGSSPQAVYSLGDEYQRLRGLAQHRSGHVRQREITCSVRSGKALETILNPIIQVHPARTKEPFHGNRWNRTAVTYYLKATVPPEPATIIVADRWGLFEWAQRLGEKVDFRLLGSHKDLSMFVQDCIELYRNGIRGRHRELFRFGSWEEVATKRHGDSAFRRIDSVLAKGYGHEDWRKTAARFENRTTAPYALGRIEDVRNQECDSVMLTPELVAGPTVAEDSTLAEIGSAVYVAVTRARRRLIVPEALRHWIEEISSHGTASLAG